MTFTLHPKAVYIEAQERLMGFYTEKEAAAWLCSPQKLLDNRMPLSLIVEGRGDDVLAVIGQLEDGVYV